MSWRRDVIVRIGVIDEGCFGMSAQDPIARQLWATSWALGRTFKDQLGI